MNSYQISSGDTDLVYQLSFYRGKTEFTLAKPADLKGYTARAIFTCTKQVLVNQKSLTMTYSSDSDISIVIVRDNVVTIQLPSQLLNQSLYLVKIILESDSYKLPVSSFNLVTNFYTTYNPGIISEEYNFTPDGYALFDVNRT